MKYVRVLNTTRGVYLASQAGLATSLGRRFLGLMGRRSLPEGAGLVLRPEGQIHMFFMRFPIDAVHADKDGIVLRLSEGIKPWRIGPIVRKSRMVVELPAGTVARSGTQPGDRITLEELPT